MTLAHMYNSRVSVRRMKSSAEDGAPVFSWKPEPGLQYVACRIDMGFLRPGKDAPMPIEAGKAPSRVGVLFADSFCGLIAGDRVTCVANDFGQTPVTGTFEIRVPPDEAQGYSATHHLEVQVIEVAQQILAGERVFPGGS